MSRLRNLSICMIVLLTVVSTLFLAMPQQPVLSAPGQQATATRRATRAPTATPALAPAASKGITETGVLKAYFLDVGQGDSILMVGPDFTILIDAGRHDRSEVVPDLKEIGVKSIDLLVGTHPHADHIGQFPEVLEAFPVREVWLSGDTNTTKTFEDTIDAIANSGAGYHEPRTGEVFQIGSAIIEVLNPTTLTGEPNEGSVSFRLRFGDVAFMFTGDAEEETEEKILETGLDLHSQIIKLGHHGSNTSSSMPFLLAVDPELAIWSAGEDNTYGHPSPETLRRLKDLKVRTLGTEEEGTIVVSTDGHTYQVIPYAPAIAPTPTPAPTRTRRTATPTPTRRVARATALPSPTAEPVGCQPGQININTASLDDLVQIVQIGPARARQMIGLRPFSSVDDMERIDGITIVSVEKIKDQGLACVD